MLDIRESSSQFDKHDKNATTVVLKRSAQLIQIGNVRKNLVLQALLMQNSAHLQYNCCTTHV